MTQIAFVNLTKHEVVLWKNGQRKNEVVFPPSGQVARLSHREDTAGFPMQNVEFKVVDDYQVEGLPEESTPHVRYIVSESVWKSAGARKDLVCPHGQASGADARRRSAKRYLRVHPAPAVERYFEAFGFARCTICQTWESRLVMVVSAVGSGTVGLLCRKCSV